MSCWIYSPSTSLDSSGGLADLCLPRNQWSNHFWWKQCTNRTGWSTHSLLLALQQVWNLPSMLLQMCENILSPLNSLLFVWIHNCNPPTPSHPTLKHLQGLITSLLASPTWLQSQQNIRSLSDYLVFVDKQLYFFLISFITKYVLSF